MVSLKMEDDLPDYEKFKNNINTKKRLFQPDNLMDNNFMSPYSIQLNDASDLDGEPDSSDMQPYFSPERVRSNPLNSAEGEDDNRRSGDYINQLLNNIMNDD